MKKLIGTLIPLIIILCVTSQIQAQSYFEGVISYKMSYSGLGEKFEGFESTLTQTRELYYSGTNFRMIDQGVGSRTEYLTTDAGKTGYVFSSILGAINVYKLEADKEEEQQSYDEVITKMNEIVKILGYTCNKYKVVIKDEDGKNTINYFWATNEIKIRNFTGSKANSSALSREGIGIVLKQIGQVDETTYTMTAQKVEAKKLDKSIFEVPKYYTIKDISEIE